MKNITEINLKKAEGRLLFAALTVLTTTPKLMINGEEVKGRSTTPDEMLIILDNFQQTLFDGAPRREPQAPPVVPGKPKEFG